MSTDEKTKRDCDTCLHKCMDMDMDPYCAHPKVMAEHSFGLSLGRPMVFEKFCPMGTHPLWERDVRRDARKLE